MLIDTSKDPNKAITYLNSLIKRGVVVEVTEKRKKRSPSQNSYFHVIVSLYAIHFGYTLNEAKQMLKYNWIDGGQKKGYEVKDDIIIYRSTASMDDFELSRFIDFVREFSDLHGCYLPTSDEYNGRWSDFDAVIKSHEVYL